MKFYFLVAITFLVSGCAMMIEKAFVAPSSGSTAKITVAPDSANIGFLYIYEQAETCKRRLRLEDAHSYKTIPADQPVSLTAFVSDSYFSSCPATFTFQPANEKYYKILAVLGNQGCSIKVMQSDTEAGYFSPVSIRQRTWVNALSGETGSFCKK